MAGHRRKRSSTPFRAWGTVLFLVLLLMIYEGNWTASAWAGGVLLFYLLAVRLTLCRVETLKHRPCRWRVRGFFSSCDYHPGLKGGPPSVVMVPGWWVPRLMWPRHDLRGPFQPQELQPRAAGSAAIAPSARGTSPQDTLMTWLAIASLAVAAMSFLRDLVAG
ncbi:MAG: hypothetical protein QOC75_1049 [Pseudonocardiales bacterium]|nr:hypothetical protein [Pseudonocardiales bacterium]